MNDDPVGASSRRAEAPDWLDAALRAGARSALPDAGFSERVMARLDALPANRPAPALNPAAAPAAALALVQRRERQERRFAAWSLGGAAFGALLAGSAWIGPDAGLATAAATLLRAPELEAGWLALVSCASSALIGYLLLRGSRA